MQNLITTLILILSVGFLNAQVKVRGIVSDEQGLSVPGATVYPASNMSLGTQTDFDGNYQITIPAGERDTIVVSFIGLRTVKFPIGPTNEKVVIQNFILKSSIEELDVVEIVSEKIDRSNYRINKADQLSSSVTFDFLPAELIKKSGASRVDDAVTQISGVSRVGNFITVRGLADRYVKTTVNDLFIPTLDPYTSNLKLDIFPTGLVDNIRLTKTANPDLPGDWAGAYISILTKDYPDKLKVSISSSFGYNSQATFQDVVSSQRSSSDWLGFDNGLRDFDHPAPFSGVSYNPTPNDIEIFEALGYGDLLEQYGFDNTNLTNVPVGSAAFNFMMVELGLLAPAQFYDPAATAAASDMYESQFVPQGSMILNEKSRQLGEDLPANWNLETRTAPINFSQNLSIGNQLDSVLGGKLGYNFGFRYSSSTRFDPDALIQRTTVTDIPDTGDIPLQVSLNQAASTERNGWSAIAQLAYKRKNSSVSFLFMPNISGVNRVQDASGVDPNFGSISGEDPEVRQIEQQSYEEREQLIYQFRGSKFFPKNRIQLDLAASYTDGVSNNPDYKRTLYVYDKDLDIFFFENTDDLNRFYRLLEEDLLHTKIDLTIPLNKENETLKTRSIKLGGSYSQNDRTNENRLYTLKGGGEISDGDLNSAFSQDKFVFDEDGKLDIYYLDRSGLADFSVGSQKISSAYLMTDYHISNRLRATGGIRAEHSDYFTDLRDLQGLPADDPARDAALPGILSADIGEINRIDLIPSLNLMYKLQLDKLKPANLRLNYSRTIARPNLREFTNVFVFDFEFQTFFLGNTDLTFGSIDNFDFRYEKLFENNDEVSVSFFYKKFQDHIETVNTNSFITWANVSGAWAAGIELSGRKELTKNLEMRANITLVESETELIRNDEIPRPLFGQSPYVLNALLGYSADSINFSANLNYNVQGPKLAIIGRAGARNIFEMPFHSLNLTLQKGFGDHWSMSLRVRNILDQSIQRSYNFDGNYAVDFDRYTFGRDFILGFKYAI